jgi:hypothetical protein
MSAIITDQLRILSTRNFITELSSTDKSYYTFIGLPNSSEVSDTWNANPPAPKDSFDEENSYWDSIIALKKINSSDIRPVIRKISWTSSTIYDMYRHDISRTNLSKPSNRTSLYSSNFYVINSEYRVYICLHNGTDPENPNGKPSLDEPKFVDLEPRTAGTSGDGYVWKYLYTISPSDVVKFDTTNFIPVPLDWETNSVYSTIRNNGKTSGQIKICVLRDRGFQVGPPNTTYTNVPVKGDGTGAEVTIVVNGDSKVESIVVSKGGSGYTYGTVDLVSGNVPTGASSPIFDVIIPPSSGHGYDIYKELGTTNVLIYSRIENDTQNPDFVTGTEIARIGIIQNPEEYDSSSILTQSISSGLNALMLKGLSPNQDDYKTTSFESNSYITQTVGTGITAVGRVVSYDQNTGVLKYWKDRTMVGFNTDNTKNLNPLYGFDQVEFTSSISISGSLKISGGSKDLYIDTNFGSQSNPGVSTVINNKTYYLGQTFINGLSNPEVKKYSGNIIYVDNRPSITRSVNQKEDIKVILQF